MIALCTARSGMGGAAGGRCGDARRGGVGDGDGGVADDG